jgi:hypothetical protein
MQDLVAIEPDRSLPRRWQDYPGIDPHENRHTVIKAFQGFFAGHVQPQQPSKAGCCINS